MSIKNPFGISILIRTFNSARTLGRVLAGMPLQPGDEYIVVDSGSTDDTLKIARQHGAKIIIADGPFNYSKSLNLGFRAAGNPWVLVLSSHAIPLLPQFIEIHRGGIRQFSPAVAVGYGPSTISAKIGIEAALDEVQFYTANNYLTVEPLCGNGNAIYRRSVWEKLPFDETIRTAEDKLWMRELFQQGGGIAFIPAARTLNCNQASLAYMYRKGFSDARARCQKGSGFDAAAHRPMRLYEFGGALKNLLLPMLRGETSPANWLRHSAHTFGQFFGSHSRQNNSPHWK